MNTEKIIEIALKLSGLKELPPDSGVVVGGDNIKRILAGVDMEVPEIMLAKQLGYDAVITHHPIGEYTMHFSEVFLRTIDLLEEAGVPIHKAERAIADRRFKLDVLAQTSNYDRAASVARLLNMPVVCLHTVADVITRNVIFNTIKKHIGDNPRAKVRDVIEAMMTIPEFQNALSRPKVRLGSEDNYAGKVFVSMSAGTDGGAAVANLYFEAGIGTLVYMHCAIPELDILKPENKGNLILSGHYAIDSIGMNVIFKELKKQGVEEITLISGLVPDFVIKKKK